MKLRRYIVFACLFIYTFQNTEITTREEDVANPKNRSQLFFLFSFVFQVITSVVFDAVVSPLIDKTLGIDPEGEDKNEKKEEMKPKVKTKKGMEWPTPATTEPYRPTDLVIYKDINGKWVRVRKTGDKTVSKYF